MAIVGAVDPMGVVSVVMNPIAQTAMVPITDHVGYMVFCRKYVMDMQTRMTELDTALGSTKERIKQNTEDHLKIPSQIWGWMEKVEGINANVENFPINAINCCSIRIRRKLGRKAFKIMQQIESLIRQLSLISWTNDPIPLGLVGSMNASTSMQSNDFPSREVTFTNALKALRPNQKSHMIALCGMGGVGKTTMMKRLREVAKEKKMFTFIVEAVIKEKIDPIVVQQAIATYLGVQLKEGSKPERADKLRQGFKAKSEEGKNKFLVILDDVWQPFDLEDIGLSPFPNQGVDFKVLLTSRDRHVCTKMGVEANSIINVGLLTEAEAQSLFCQFVDTTSDPDLHKIGEHIVRKCGCLPIAIKTMACTLRYMSKDKWNDALTSLERHNIDKVVNEAFELSYENLHDQETKSIFLLCGLFPEDFNIPTEELVRYGWGLKLFKKVYTITEARTRLNTCIERLIHTNLLMESDDVGCVKMHDLVLAFVLKMFSKVEYASVVNHSSMLGWPEIDINTSSCQRISLTCNAMSDFPEDLKFPNLTILKLMHEDNSLRFPQDFYEGMEKLRVISYDEMKYPLIPPSAQCSANLRVLHLHACSLQMFDCSSIGKLLNLEVLSFANSGIEWLPSTIGNLKKLRLLDLTNCDGLRIDNGVLRNLVKLEELYMRPNDSYRKAIIFTDENCNELVELSENLSVLEFVFIHNNVQPQQMSFKKLQSFKISVGCYLYPDLGEIVHSSGNTLMLVTRKDELLESRLNELFEKTEVLLLSVGDMDNLEELVEVKSPRPPQSSLFYNLRVLSISECAELRYIYTPGVANTLSKLEYLEVCHCGNIEELIHNRGSEEATITFPKLKSLFLSRLPKLMGLCSNANIIELPELVELKLERIPGFTSIYLKNKLETSSLLKEEVVIPKLEKLHIDDMENLKEIWPYESSTSEKIKLREIHVSNCYNLVNLFPCNPIPLLHHLEELRVENCWSMEVLFNITLDCVGKIGESNYGLKIIKVSDCDNLVNLFPCNPIPMLHHLEELIVEKCDSIEVLFDIDLDSIGEIGQGSSLRSIKVEELGKLREMWRIKGEDNSRLLIRGFQAVESISIWGCKRFRNVCTPITTNFDLGALTEISIKDCGEYERDYEFGESSEEEGRTGIISKEETSQVTDSISKVVLPSSLAHSFHNLRRLYFSNYEGMEVVFEIESPTSGELIITHRNQQRLLPNLKKLELRCMHSMSHVWKCNWNAFLVLHKQQSQSPFHNLTTIKLYKCNSITYLFSPLMAKLLSNLKKVQIDSCDGIEGVVSNKDDEDEENTTSSHTSTGLFPRLDSLYLFSLDNLKCIGGGDAKDGSDEISLHDITITSAFVDQFKACRFSWSLCEYVREISIMECHALSSVIPCYAARQMQKLQVMDVHDCKGMKEVFETQGNNNIDEGNDGIPRLNNVLILPNLKILIIYKCESLKHIFTFSTLESLRQLEELTINRCQIMKVIVKEEDDKEQTTNTYYKVVVFPRLKSIELVDLPELEGFFLGKNEFRWPSLDTVTIKECPKMMVFAPGGSTAPKLQCINTSLGKYSVKECGLNFHVTTATHHQIPIFPSVDGTSLFPATTSEGTPWSFHNLIEFDMEYNNNVKKIIPSDELLQLQNLEKITVYNCDLVEEVFEELEGTNSGGVDKLEATVVNLLNLRQVELEKVDSLRYIWKDNQWTLFEFPNLTTLSIYKCKSLEHVFSSSMVGSLLQLQELHITECDRVEVIVKDENVVVHVREEESHSKTNEITLPCLKSLRLKRLLCLKGFCLGKEDFSFPLLDTLIIKECTKMTIFTKGNSATPQLKEIETEFDSYYAGEDINSFIKAKREREEFSTDDSE